MDCLRRVGGLTQARPCCRGMFISIRPQPGRRRTRASPPPTGRSCWPGTRGGPGGPVSSWITAWACRPCCRELAFEAFGEVDASVSRDPEPCWTGWRAAGPPVPGGGCATLLVGRTSRWISPSGPPPPVRPWHGRPGLSLLAALLDAFYQARGDRRPGAPEGAGFPQNPHPGPGRLARKMALQERNWPPQAPGWTGCAGDLITANLYRMEKGARVLRTENYYDPDGGQVEIPLDPLKTPQQNAARYYKNYTKAKTAGDHAYPPAGERGPGGGLSGQRSGQRVPGGGDRDLEEIRQELVETGYLRRRAKARTG